MARPRKKLTDEQVVELRALSAVLSQEQIADYFGMSRKTFYEMLQRDNRVSTQYKKGRSQAIASIAGNLIKQAKAGNTSAAIFYLKTQAGWKETDNDKTDQEAQPLNITFNVTEPQSDIEITKGD